MIPSEDAARDGHLVEVVHGRDRVRTRLLELVEGRRPREALEVQRPLPPLHLDAAGLDYARRIVDDDVRNLREGTISRTITTASALEDPVYRSVRWDRVRRAGEVVRTVPGGTTSTVILDRQLVIVPVGDDGSAAFIREPVLVDGHLRRFEATWDEARPSPLALPELPTLDRAVLLLLATGATDRAVAAKLHVSERSVRRRVAALMQVVGAESRFQLGMHLDDLLG